MIRLCILCFLATVIPLHAADERKHPIDLAMEAAIDRDPSTAGMVRAISKANAAWDREMNVLYQDLRKKTEPGEWAALAQAQKAWIVYRDAQTKSLVETYGRMDGTMWIPVSAREVMEITRQRTLFLESLSDTLSGR